MPTYEYECSACEHSFEVVQSMTEPKLTKCPKCRKAKLQRLIGGGSGLIFKGSGFYETDYKRKSETPASAPAKSPSSGCACAAKGSGHSCGG